MLAIHPAGWTSPHGEIERGEGQGERCRYNSFMTLVSWMLLLVKEIVPDLPALGEHLN